MALDQSALLEVLDALRNADAADRIKQAAETIYQALIDAELSAVIGAGISLVIHQPSYSLLNRWIESGLTDALRSARMGAIAFTALAQGLLTDRYATEDAANIDRATNRPTLPTSTVTDEVLAKIRGLKTIADGRGQSLAQMRSRGCCATRSSHDTNRGSSVAQLDENLGALDNLDFSNAELTAIDEYATDAGVDIWRSSSDLSFLFAKSNCG